MNKYQVEYTTLADDETVIASSLYIDAVSRESALYLAFDELSDTGMASSALSFGSVMIQDDEGRWVETHAHVKVKTC